MSHNVPRLKHQAIQTFQMSSNSNKDNKACPYMYPAAALTVQANKAAVKP